jgi:hypothetical protein
MRKKNQPSRVYLLRCWQERETASDQDPHWRFLVEEVLQDERRRKGFTSLSALCAFLETELASDEERASSVMSEKENENDQ